jgi:GT2 family glycosyltransferase
MNMSADLNLPRVAVVILNYNGIKYLSKFLPSVLQSSYGNLEVIIADNASTDGSVTWLSNHYPQIKIIHNKKNYGFAQGYNEAFKFITAPYLVLLNSDVEVTAGWIEPVIELMNNDETIAACQPKILSFKNKDEFEYAGACGGWIDFLGYPFCRGRIFEHVEVDLNQYNDVQEIFWATGAAMFIKKNVFDEMNGFDESFFAHQEEIDLCWRLKGAGYKIMVQPASVVYHVGGGTLPVGSRKVYLNFRNNLKMLWKNLFWYQKPIVFIARFFLDGLAMLKNLIKADIYFVKAVFLAYVSFIIWLLSKNDKKFYPKQKKHRLQAVLKSSVLWAYFGLQKKTFKEIV